MEKNSRLADPTTWPQPSATQEVEDPDWGQVQIQHWSQLHFRASAAHPMQLVRIVASGKSGRNRSPKPMWLGWLGGEMPSLEQTWRVYLLWFAVDHWNRLAKQRLHWTLPQVGTPQQAERWSDLMPLISWQLWLASEIVQDNPLPWQKPQTDLTPGRVAQGFPALLAAIGTLLG